MDATGIPSSGSPNVSIKPSYFPRSSSEQSCVENDKEKIDALVKKIAWLSSDNEQIPHFWSLSPRIQLQLTSDAIEFCHMNNYTWRVRRKVIRKKKDFLLTELDTIMGLPIDLNHHNVWYHRHWIAKKFGFVVMKSEYYHAFDHLSGNPQDNSYGAWRSLKILSKKLGRDVFELEFEMVKKIIEKNYKNHHAWGYLCHLSQDFVADTASRELKEVIKFLMDKPDLKAPWDYLDVLALRLVGSSKRRAIILVDGIVEEMGLNRFACLYRKESKAWDFVCLNKEIEFTKKVLLKDPSDDVAWGYRLELLKKAGLLNLDEELTRKILSEKKNANNARVWYQRKLFLEACGGWDAEMEHSASFVEEDDDNECAWQHRSFVVLGCNDLEDVDSMRSSEVKHVMEAILKNPKNRFLWMYLQSLYIPTPSDNTELGSLFEKVCLEGHVQNSGVIVNALETLDFVMRVGFSPSTLLVEIMNYWFSEQRLSLDNVKKGHISPNPSRIRGKQKIDVKGEGELQKIVSLIKGNPNGGELWWALEDHLRMSRNQSKKNACLVLELCDEVIQANKFNQSAWDQRYFVVGKLAAPVQLFAEAVYAKKVILETPENEHAWAYIRCMYRQCKVGEKIKFKDGLLDDLFLFVFGEIVENGKKDGRKKKYVGYFKQSSLLNELHMDIITNKTKLINASEALMDLLCVGYLPTPKLVDVLLLLSPSTEGGFPEAIGNILEFVYPVGVRYWRWRVEETRKMLPKAHQRS